MVALTTLAGTASLLAGCAGGNGPPAATRTASGGTRVLQVVAAENFWGSIAAQVGGARVHVTSIISNPNTDPHDYEPSAGDARAIADADLVIENGVGYDSWAARLLAADSGGPTTLDVGDVLGLPTSANPHRWYNPTDVTDVVARLSADYQKLDPGDRGYFARRAAQFEGADLAAYHREISTIRSRFAGTPVGASESIFAMLAPALDLDLVTPPSFLRAISEGTDVSIADKETIDRQISRHQIKIYVYNSQNVTPDVQAQLAEARQAHIPVATITETMQPARTTYEAWQTRQLVGIESALERAGA